MMKDLKLLLLSLIACTTLTGCSKTIMGLYGMKDLKAVDETTVLKLGNKYNIPKADSYLLDTAYYSYLISFDRTKYKVQIKNHYQPLQALYYGNAGNLQSFQINCNAGGFPNLNWGRDEIFSTFIPKEQTPLDSIVPFGTHLKFLMPLSTTEGFATHGYDYFIVVHWNRFMGRQSKRLIRLVQQNEKLSGGKKVKIIYVNNDNLFAGKE